MKRRGFPDGWFSSGVDPEKLSPNVVGADRWDRAIHERMLAEAAALAAATDTLAEVAPTGRPLMADLFNSLHKAAPEIVEPTAVRPDHMINRSVMQEAFDLSEWQSVRNYTRGDDVAAAMAAASLEPDIETLLDRQQLLAKQAEQLQETMAQLAAAQAEKVDLDEMVERWMSPDADPAVSAEQMEAIAGQGEGLDAQIDQLSEDAEAQGAALVEQLEREAPSTQATLARAMGRASQAARDAANMSRAWGLEPGTLQRMPADQRLALAKRLNSPRLRRIAELFGPMRNLAMTEQMRKTEHAVDEVVGVTIGSDLERVIPTELVKLGDPLRSQEFFRDFAEHRLPMWQLEGQEKVGKGAIILAEDGSGSMRGEPELWAKAVMLCLMHIARQQKRVFRLIHFGSPGQIKVISFEKPSDYTIERILDAAELFFGGGTDLVTPLNQAVEWLRLEHAEKAFVTADIVLVTDGIVGVPEQWRSWFEEEKARLKFALWGILIGMPRDSEPVYTLADHRTCDVRSLMTGEEVRDVFRAV